MMSLVVYRTNRPGVLNRCFKKPSINKPRRPIIQEENNPLAFPFISMAAALLAQEPQEEHDYKYDIFAYDRHLAVCAMLAYLPILIR